MPFKKQFPPDYRLEYLCISLFFAELIFCLSQTKGLQCSQDARAVRDSRRKLPNDMTVAPWEGAMSVTHMLLHASDWIPLMCPHLYVTRKCRKANDVDGGGVVLGSEAITEFDWYQSTRRISINRRAFRFTLQLYFERRQNYCQTL